MRKALVALLAPAALLVAACGSSSSSSTSSTASAAASSSSAPAASGLVITTRTVPGVGSVLVNGQGRTLYIFEPDHDKKVTCVGACASVWPPLKTAAGAKPTVSGGLSASMVSSDPDPSGGQVVTYAGWPLYLYVGDPSAGSDHGQGLNSSGGLWYVISPAGKVVTAKASSAASSSSGGGGGYG
jgi:predicted lipoprotein with Yx(FWY)xxD motif